MSSAKIVVLSLKEILRVVMFVIFGIFVVCMLMFLFLPKSDSLSTNEQAKSLSNVYKDGEYTSKISIDKGQSYVQVTINDSNITDVKIVNQDEVANSFYPLLETVCNTINDKILSENSITIDTDYTNQVTTYVVTNAINEALSTAKN